MISIPQAVRTVLGGLPLMGCEEVGLLDACGRVLAEEVQATRDVPPFRNSAMDGYAVRAADLASLPTELSIAEVIAAGQVPKYDITAGNAAAIMTGAIVPDGADTVVRVEDTERIGESRVRILVAPAAGANIRLPGEDIRAGDTVLTAGQMLRPADVGLLASLSRARAVVRRRPRVAILTTGDELVEPGDPLGPGQIVNSNAYTLAAAVRQAGATPEPLGIVRDDPAETRAAFARALEHDVVLSTGGVSMGTFDLVRETLGSLGVEEKFWKVAQKPGKPLSFGRRGEVAVFGLPGNPVSSLVCFYLYVVPALRTMLGLSDIYLATVPARAADSLRTADGLVDLIRCMLEGPADALRARATGTQSSGALRSMSLGDGLMISPAGETRIEPGQSVRVIVLDGRTSTEPPVMES